MRTAEAVSLLFILFCRDPQFRRALYKLDPVLFRRFTNGGGVAVNVDDMTDEEFIDYCRNGVEPTPSMRSICVIWRIGGTLVIVRNVMSMHAGTGRSIWLRLGLRLVSMPPPISVRWLNTIAVGGRSIPRNTPSMRRSGNVNDN